MTRERNAAAEQSAFVLHTYPYRETSLIVELFTRDHGRVALVARGARRPRSTLRGVLQPFQPLLVNWFGKGEMRTLGQAEWIGGQPLLQGSALYCGFYVNELILRLLTREDPHGGLFDCYRETVSGLARRGRASLLLRRFEKSLLQEIGYALVLDRDASSGRAVEADQRYAYIPESGPVLREPDENAVQFSGRTLLDIQRDDYSDPQTASESKQLMRLILGFHLGGHDLQTRRIFRELGL